MNEDHQTSPSPEGWVYTDDIVKKYCVGKGVEIGPSDNPVKGVDTVLVDNKTDFAGKHYRVDYVMEADNLYQFQDNQFDFLIASHMLEHFPNPIKALKEWYRVVRDGGVLFIVVPQKGRTFDKYRGVTPLSHFIEDYEKNVSNPDPTHIDEWCNYSVPVIEAEQRDKTILVDPLNGSDPTSKANSFWEKIEGFRTILKQQVKEGTKIDIHFHTWEWPEDMLALMDYLGWEVIETIGHYAIGRPVGEGNGILTVVRVHKSKVPTVKTRILFLSVEEGLNRVPEVGTRFYEMARRLSKLFPVTHVTIGICSQEENTFKESGNLYLARCNPGDENTLKKYVDACEVVVLQRQILDLFPSTGFLEKISVVDLSLPPFLENLDKAKDPMVKIQIHPEAISQLNHLLRMGDYFLYAHEAQRDFWLGMLYSQNRITSRVYEEDPYLKNLIDLVPSGIPEEKPVHSRQVLKGVYPGIKLTDKLLIWTAEASGTGGSIEGLDPITLLKAFVLIRRERSDIKLLFMGQERLFDAIDMAKTFALYNTMVFFSPRVSSEEKSNYLLEADVGVSIHSASLAAQFSSRNQILDYIWAGLPILTTRGDSFSYRVDSQPLGLSVAPGDAEGLATAILKLMDDEDFRQRCTHNIQAISKEFTWDNTLKPLIKFCRNPRKSKKESIGMEEYGSRGVRGYEGINTYTSPLSHSHTSPLSRFPTPNILGFFANLRTFRRRKQLKLTEYPSCGIWGKNQVGQSFIASYPNLYRIDIKFATYFRRNTRNLTFCLRKDGKKGEEIISLSLKASEIRDNRFYSFVFPQQPDSQGKLYYFYLESQDSPKEEAISVWCTESYSPIQFGCQPIAGYERGWKSRGHVIFRAYYI
ncbi:MAG TPA: methyltransferase domain-containing protein [Candidatus Limnocylindrales bacterium]|nr:methyltransferase domain-containing protein [Candidatus Limnocylindrales bacterium]